jgi:RNase P subunit RPR2
MIMKKPTWLTDKKLRCKNCKYFTLKFISYETKNDFHVKCSNCNADFFYHDRSLVEKIKQLGN